MKVRELVEKLNLTVLSGAEGLDREIDGCYVSDLQRGRDSIPQHYYGDLRDRRQNIRIN